MHNDNILQFIRLISKKHFDGHFTIMKFTTNYRISFGSQPDTRKKIEAMASGSTLLDALIGAIQKIDLK